MLPAVTQYTKEVPIFRFTTRHVQKKWEVIFSMTWGTFHYLPSLNFNPNETLLHHLKSKIVGMIFGMTNDHSIIWLIDSESAASLSVANFIVCFCYLSAFCRKLVLIITDAITSSKYAGNYVQVAHIDQLWISHWQTIVNQN